MDSGVLQVILVTQLTLVSLFFLRALRRSAQLSRPVATPQATPKPRSDADDRSVGAEELARLEAERDGLLSTLERLRAVQTKEEDAFRARRREVLLDLHEHRRVSNELSAIEPELRSRVDSLRTEVEHLERRLPELAAEVRASTRSSIALRGRVAAARLELEGLRRDHDRVRERLGADKERLGDLARRRALLRAETEELAALARSLQRVTGGTRLLSQVTDGELRDRSAQQVDQRAHARDTSGRHDGAVDHQSRGRQDTEARDLQRVLHLRHRRLDAGLHERLVDPLLEDLAVVAPGTKDLDVLHADSLRRQAR